MGARLGVLVAAGLIGGVMPLSQAPASARADLAPTEWPSSGVAPSLSPALPATAPLSGSWRSRLQRLERSLAHVTAGIAGSTAPFNAPSPALASVSTIASDIAEVGVVRRATTGAWIAFSARRTSTNLSGTQINMAMAPGQVRPGAWGTFDEIPSVDFVRNDLAVTPGFKPDVGYVQTFEVPEGAQIQVGTVGPQTYGGVTYPGGANQVQILPGPGDVRPTLIPVGPPRAIG